MRVAYGTGNINLELDPRFAEWHVLSPRFPPPLQDARAVFLDACAGPIQSPPLRQLIGPKDRITIVTSDGTRPVPNHLLVTWLLELLEAPEENVTVLLGNGTHRANTPAEIAAMFGADVAAKVRIENHNAFDPAANVDFGNVAGMPVSLDRRYVEADKRILLGFIEPHFFAGFSGGPKAIAPGIVGIDTIFHLHGYDLIAHPKSTWGILEGNPVQEAIGRVAGVCPPDFLINVTLDGAKQITGVFAGDYRAAHRAGCEKVREQAMVPVDRTFPVVITSNSGFPLDQNLYQTVKGMSAGAQILSEDGPLIVASECRDGIPNHGRFGQMLLRGLTPQQMDEEVRRLEHPALDQWQVQTLASIQKKARVSLYSSMDAATVAACGITPIENLQTHVEQAIHDMGRGIPVAVLPEGPVTIPYLA